MPTEICYHYITHYNIILVKMVATYSTMQVQKMELKNNHLTLKMLQLYYYHHAIIKQQLVMHVKIKVCNFVYNYITLIHKNCFYKCLF